MKHDRKWPAQMYNDDKPAPWKKRAALYGELTFWAATFATIWMLIPLPDEQQIDYSNRAKHNAPSQHTT